MPTRKMFSGVRKVHKAVLGALLLSGKSLHPYQYGKKIFWTLDFMAPTGPVWDVNANPLLLTEDKVREMIDLGYLTIVSDTEVSLTVLGATLAEDSQDDWYWWWKGFFEKDTMPNGRPLDWVHYFETGTMRST